MGRSTKGVVVAALACASLAACDGHLNKEGFFTKGHLSYRVGALDPEQWQQVKSEGNDLAWIHRHSAHILSVNATCDDHGDPPLDVLTTHLLFGFTDRTQKSRQTKMIDGRQALVSSYVAKLDGVPVEIALAVLKKNDCVHDFVYIAPVGRAAEHQADFDRLLSDFTADRT
jgi:hypothetical protein